MHGCRVGGGGSSCRESRVVKEVALNWWWG